MSSRSSAKWITSRHISEYLSNNNQKVNVFCTSEQCGNTAAQHYTQYREPMHVHSLMTMIQYKLHQANSYLLYLQYFESKEAVRHTFPPKLVIVWDLVSNLGDHLQKRKHQATNTVCM